ncbi:hypothetical protein JYU34_009931, partial [Plutella xylostella]
MLGMYSISGYDLNSYTRPNRKGGGVLIYTHTDLAARVIEPPFTMLTAECVIVSINKNNIEIIIVGIYRPPKINQENKVVQFLDELNLLLKKINNDKIIICGDININLLDTKNKNISHYENIMARYGYSRCISKVTRREILKGEIVESCIDHIFVKCPSYDIYSAVIEHKMADHYCTTVALSSPELRRCLVPPTSAAAQPPLGAGGAAARGGGTTRRFIDNKLVQEKLDSVEFSELLNLNCPLELYNKIYETFASIYEDCCRTKVIKCSGRDDKGWVDASMKRMILERDRLFILWCNDKSNMLKRLNYTRLRNKCNKLFFKIRNEYTKRKIIECNGNIKKIWENINNLLGRTKQSTDDLIQKYIKDKSQEEISNNFAYTFINDIDKIVHDCDKKFLDRTDYVNTSPVCMRWKPATARQVLKVIKLMSSNKSPGSDNIRMRDIKIVSEKISPIIAHLINLCIKFS